jgi:alpha-amylase
MASIVFYFQVHQPHRLRRYSVFDADPFYFEDAKNGAIAREGGRQVLPPDDEAAARPRQAARGQLPRSRTRSRGPCSTSSRSSRPDVIDLFQELAETGCCEFVGETYYHSLSVPLLARRVRGAGRDALREDPGPLRAAPARLPQHRADLLQRARRGARGHAQPGRHAAVQGRALRGHRRLLGYRSPNYVYRPPAFDPTPSTADRDKPFGLLLKNFRLSDDIAFRFSNRGWEEWPLSAEKFASGCTRSTGTGTSATCSWTTRPSASTSGPTRGSSSSSTSSPRRSSTSRRAPRRTTSRRRRGARPVRPRGRLRRARVHLVGRHGA